MLHTRQPQTTEAIARMAVRNEARVAIIKRALGTRYAHHPVNHVRPVDAPPRGMPVFLTTQATVPPAPKVADTINVHDRAERCLRRVKAA